MKSLDKEKKLFLARFVLFVVTGCVLPFTFIAWRYELFRAKPMSLTGWGFIAIIIVFFFVIYVARTLKQCFPHTMFAQCVSGFCKVILPLSLLLLMVNGIKENIDAFIQALSVTIICECFAIPINPIPKYMYDNQIKREDLRMDMFFTKYKEANKQIENK